MPKIVIGEPSYHYEVQQKSVPYKGGLHIDGRAYITLACLTCNRFLLRDYPKSVSTIYDPKDTKPIEGSLLKWPEQVVELTLRQHRTADHPYHRIKILSPQPHKVSFHWEEPEGI